MAEYCSNGSLQQLLMMHAGRGDIIKWDDAISFACDLAAAVGYLHTRQPVAVMHRDLKPANCLLTAAGTLKLTDFGLSKMLFAPKAEGGEGSNNASRGRNASTRKGGPAVGSFVDDGSVTGREGSVTGRAARRRNSQALPCLGLGPAPPFLACVIVLLPGGLRLMRASGGGRTHRGPRTPAAPPPGCVRL